MSCDLWKWTLFIVFVWCGSETGSLQAYAGVMAESTRVIYLEGQKERTLMLANTNAYPVLVQVWTNHGEDTLAPQQALTPLIAVPPVFRLDPGALQGLRLILNSDYLSVDRESVFWLNIYEVPPTFSKASVPSPRVAVAMNTQMKVFYRPKAMAEVGNDLISTLRFKLRSVGDQRCLVVQNSSPYHASFSSLKLVEQSHELSVIAANDMMTAPLSERCYDLPKDRLFEAANSNVHFILLNDNGHMQEGRAQLDSAQ